MIGVVFCPNVSATRRSFHVQRNWKIASDAIAGRPSGRIRRRKIVIFVRLILPLGLPAIASLSIFQFLWTWNDLLVALTFGQNTTPITVWIAGQLREFGTSIDIIAPASFISLVVPLCVFFAFQRYFVQGLLAGSVK